MKKLLLVLMIVVVGLLSACGSEDTETSSTTENVSTSEVTTEETTTEVVEEKSLDNLSAYLVEKGVVTGEKTDTMYQMIDAIGGFKYLDSDVEVYKYDTNSDVYKTIVETGEYSGMKFVAINDQFVLLMTNNTDGQDVIQAFNEY